MKALIVTATFITGFSCTGRDIGMVRQTSGHNFAACGGVLEAGGRSLPLPWAHSGRLWRRHRLYERDVFQDRFT